MQKAFRITFSWLFKDKPDFVLTKGHGQSTYIFTKIVQKQNTKLNKTIKSMGEELMSPIAVNWEKGPMVRRSRSKMGNLAKRVVRKASTLAGPPKKSSPISRSQTSISNSNAMVSNQLETSTGVTQNRVSFIMVSDHNRMDQLPTPVENEQGLRRLSAFIARKMSPRPKLKSFETHSSSFSSTSVQTVKPILRKTNLLNPNTNNQ